MSVSSLVKQFDSLTREQILAFQPGAWRDDDLLESLKFFEKEKKDSDRAMAVAELILRSPQMDSINYSTLYLDLIGHYRWKDDFPAALRWAHALITFGEQHEGDLNRANRVRDLAEIYLEAGDLDTGLALFTRLAQASPGDIWDYNALGLALPRAGLPGLALEVLDRALALTTKNDPEHLKKQLTEQRHEVGETLTGMPDHNLEVSPNVLADFRTALLTSLPANSRKSTRHKEIAPYLPPITRLIKLGSAGDAMLEAEVLAQAKVLIPELIRLAFDEEASACGASTHAVRLLRQMRDARTAELGELSTWLDRASVDWQQELFTRRFAKIGCYTTSELETIAADIQSDTFTRINALEALQEQVKRLPALRARFITLSRTMLTRPAADTAGEERIVGSVISRVLDLEARELYPEIKQAFVEDRVDKTFISPRDIQRHWGLLPIVEPERRKDGMYLALRCTACNRTREHFVQNVILDLNTFEQQTDDRPITYDPHIMDREIVCPKCAAVDHYAMTSQALVNLLVLPKKLDTLTEMFAGRKPVSGLPPNPRLHRVRSSVFGKPMHPLAGLEEYRRRIAANPRDAKLYMRMGTLLRTIYRDSAALEAHQQAYALNPNDAEIALVLGFSEHDFGDPLAAKKMYERVLTLELEEPGSWDIARSNSFASAAAEGLELLKGRQSSAWALPVYNPTSGKQTIVNPRDPTPPASSRKRHQRKGY